MRATHVFTVANEILEQTLYSLENLQLQKLVYIANGYSLAILNEPLFHNKCMAWQFGPTIPELYEKLLPYGANRISDPIVNPYREELSGDSKAMIEYVIRGYAKFSGVVLATITHKKGTPWHTVWNSGKQFSEIPNHLIKEYYLNRLYATRKRVADSDEQEFKMEKRMERGTPIASYVLRKWVI